MRGTKKNLTWGCGDYIVGALANRVLKLSHRAVA